MGIDNIEELFNLPPKKRQNKPSNEELVMRGVDDVAPDADEKGDDLPDELRFLVHQGDIVPDNVDKQEIDPGRAA